MKRLLPVLVWQFLFVVQLFAKDPDLIFMHIPKTGGITVSTLIGNETEQIKNSFYFKHAPLYELQETFALDSIKLVTFLREPVSRVISEHRYIMTKHGGSSRICHSHQLPFGDPLYTAKNEMCKFLSGLNPKDDHITSEMHLEAAKNALNRFYFVGITENMQESIALLFSGLGWPIPEKIPTFNVSTDDETFSQEVLDGIRERNWADCILYEYALEVYEKQKDSFSINPFYYSQEAKKNLSFGFDMPIRGYGWASRYDGEYNRQGSRRWADSNNEATADFWLQAGFDYSFTLRMHMAPIFYDDFVLFVNDVPVALSLEVPIMKEGEEPTNIRVTGTIPKFCIYPDKPTRLKFRLQAPSKEAGRQVFQKWENREKRHNCQRGHFACDSINFQGQ